MSTQKPASSGPPLRALAMVLIALAILFAGLGFASLGSSDSDEAASTRTTTTTTSAAAGVGGADSAGSGSAATTTSRADTTTTTTSSTTTSGAATTSLSPADKSAISVRVFNNSNVTGLAGDTATELTDSGWTVVETGNYNAGTIPSSTVYYGTGAAEKAAASAIAAKLGVTAEPRFPGIADSPAGVIVIVTQTG